MLVDLYAVVREKENGVPCMGYFSCAFAFRLYFRVWSSYKKNFLKTSKLKNLKKTFFKNLGFSSPVIICILMQPVKWPSGPLLLKNKIGIPIGVASEYMQLAR